MGRIEPGLLVDDELKLLAYGIEVKSAGSALVGRITCRPHPDLVEKVLLHPDQLELLIEC